MWPQEKARYSQAVLSSKRLGFYDWYIDEHSRLGPWGHGGPSFLPWHRQFIRQFELQLRALDSGVTLPYWDWTVDQGIEGSTLWSEYFMGGTGRMGDNQVLNGPFTYANGNGWVCRDVDRPYLRRQLGGFNNTVKLPTEDDVKACLAQVPYDQAPWDSTDHPSFRNYLEGGIGPGIHNLVHGWVSGNMGDVLSAPNDPVFFLHHANVDRIWTVWQKQHPNAYAPVSGGPPGQNQPDVMHPWEQLSVRISSVLDHTALGYVYDIEEPTAQGNGMLPGDVLRPRDRIYSPNGAYALVYEELGGRLTLYDNVNGNRLLWQVPQNPTSLGKVIMDPDGSLIVYDATGVVWSSNTPHQPGNRMYLSMTGQVQIYNMAQKLVPWAAPEPA
ncbi:tyrosinase family protein [Streptomyces sp. NPDC005775]|uniref:tyrosinase family protein n=1 Tax=Streptomyces sp. NPDC005775 TaxID=3364729 RepID=UPI0036B5370B